MEQIILGEIRIRPLSALAEFVTGNFGLHSASSKGEFCTSALAEAEIIAFGRSLLVIGTSSQW